MLKLLINLEQSTDRLARMKALFAQYEMTFERIDAVDGRKMSKQALDAKVLPLERRKYWLKDMTAGEIGCYLSHVKAWKRLVSSEHDWAFICEDDIAFAFDPCPYLMTTEWIPQGVGLVQLGNHPAKTPVVREPELKMLDDGHRLMVVTQGAAGGTMGYMIHRRVAEAMLTLSEQLKAPVDDMLFFFASPIREKFKPWSLSPALILSDDQGITFVGNDKAKVKTPKMQVPLAYLGRQLTHWCNKVDGYLHGVKDIR